MINLKKCINLLLIFSFTLPLFFVFSNEIQTNNLNFKFSNIANIFDISIYDSEKIDTSGHRNILNKALPLNLYISVFFYFFFLIKKINNPFFSKFNKIFLIIFTSLCIASLLQGSFEKKIIHILQYLLPTISILIGYFYFHNEIVKYKSIIVIKYFLTVLISFQIILSFHSGLFTLRANLILFTIYQNIQYVSSILVFMILSAFLLQKRFVKTDLIILFILHIYAFLSLNFSTILILISGMFCLLVKENKKKYLFLFLLIIVVIYNLINNLNIHENHNHKFSHNYSYKLDQLKNIQEFKIPNNIKVRLEIYEQYFKSEKNLSDFIFGNKNPNLFDKFSGAHNIYLDGLYYFGIGFLILLLLITFVIINSIYTNEFNYFFFYFSVYFLIENLFKEALKQPYTAIIIYIIFGYIIKETYYKKSNI